MPRKRALEDHVLDVVAQQPVVDVPGNGVLVDGEASQGSLHSVKRKKKRVQVFSKSDYFASFIESDDTYKSQLISSR